MADSVQLNRIQNFYGGISTNDKDKVVGVCSNIEEMDIFSNVDYMEPNTIFGVDATITRQITGYTIGDMNDITVGGTLYALGRTVDATPLAQIWRKTSADSISPSAWVAVKTSAYNSNLQSPIAWHRVTVPSDDAVLGVGHVDGIVRSGSTATFTTLFNHGLTTNNIIAITVSGVDQVEYNGTFKGTVTGVKTITYTVSGTPVTPATTILAGGITVSYAFLYYVTGIQQLTRAEITDSTSPAAFSEATVSIADADHVSNPMVLSGLGAANNRIPMCRYNGELFIGHGRYIAKVATDGVIETYALTLPNGWEAISLAPYAHNMAILARNIAPGTNNCKIYYWDLANTTGFIDESVITMGGPQIIINFNESLWAICAINGSLNTYRIQDKLPVLVHVLDDISLETNTQAIIPDATKFVKDKAFYFGLWKTDKSGLYAIGQVEPGKPYALVLAKRFHTSDYSKHKPYAAISVGDNWYASFDDNTTASVAKAEGTSQVRSSNAIYETIWLDLNSPETPKTWEGFLIGTKVLPANCQILVDAKVDNATSYNTNSLYTLTPSNDQEDSGITADTFWFRDWTSVYGRMAKIRLRFVSSTTSRATVYFLSFLSRLGVTI